MTLELQKQMLIQKAKNKLGKIYPIQGKDFEPGFQIMDIKNKKMLLFYYNDKNGSTHLEQTVLNN